jgi:hypothetical protein
MAKIDIINTYIIDFLSTRLHLYDAFYKDEFRHRREGIYTLPNGSMVMDFLYSTIKYLEELYNPKLVPKVFSNYKELISSLSSRLVFLEQNQILIDSINSGSNWKYTKDELQSIKNEVASMLEAVLEIDKNESELILPFQEMRNALITKNLDLFIGNIKSLLANIPNALYKDKEGYLHSNIILICKLLGFELDSEKNTNIGRIDATIKIASLVYIFEFKNSTAKTALEQIIKNKYYEMFIVDKVEIIMVGVSFSSELKNIDDFEWCNYNSILETNHLMLTEANQNRLDSALSNIKSGNVVENGLIYEADLGS